MRTLLVMRHAKSDWDADYGSDHERPLNERGVRSARLMGRVLTREDLEPDLIITSTAVRALSTATLAKEAGDWESDIVLEPALYGGGPDSAFGVAAAAPDLGRVMLVGHQPTWSILVSMLSGERVDMKTATVAVIHFDVDAWQDLRTTSGRLGAVLHPGDHDDGAVPV